mmetsp:Transcript_7791/g.12393  ORF Transcript_7791/g.12393 Transcript_7791/m.12393 type:complete len:113 (+) Transcript_7791:224-562(+)
MYNRKPGGGPSAGESKSYDMMESQNEQMIGSLQSKIGNLKNITIAIGDEVREQNRQLEEMQSGMGSTDNMINSTMNKMKVMYQSHGSMSVVYLSVFLIVTFLVLYGLLKMTR